MHPVVRRALKASVNLFGADLVSRETTASWQRQSVEKALAQIPKVGCEIRTVFDVGAAHGTWGEACAQILPGARIVMFEPLTEFVPVAAQRLRKMGTDAEFHQIGLGSAPGEREFHVHPDLVGSSFYLEDEDGDVNGVARKVRVDTLDRHCSSHEYSRPYLLKIDAQGAELDILKGAGETLQGSEYVLIECSLFDFYGNGTGLIPVIEAMQAHGFVPYDMVGHTYRPLDDALAQLDVAFVRAGGIFQRHHQFASSDQRAALTERLKRLNATLASER